MRKITWVRNIKRGETMTIKIVVDSSIDLPDELIDQTGVEIVPLTVSFGADHYLDRIEITPEEFQKRMSREKELPKTAQPAPGKFLEVFDKLGQMGHQVLCLCLSSALSGSYNSARLAKSMTTTEVEVVDTLSGSAGLGILSYLSTQWTHLGKSLQDITEEVQKYAENLTVYALLDTVENAVKGGRLSPIKGAIASLLNLKIICEVKQGKVDVIEKVRGTQKAYERLATLVNEKVQGRPVPMIGIAHVDNKKGAGILQEMVAKNYSDALFFQTAMGATIGTYAGKGGLVLAF